jgi:predicted RecA/RadA family phage recombinase
MATNQKRLVARRLSLAATDPTTPASGDPVLVGQIPGVATVAKGAGGNATANTSIDTAGSYNLSVKGVDGGGNSAVAVGDIIYYALEAITSGSTATIEVKLGY